MNYYSTPYFSTPSQYIQTPAVQGGYYPQPPQQNTYKMVDSVEVVKATEVPLGSYAVFLKGDFSEAYVKYWNNNGTTNILTFTPNKETQTKEEEKEVSISNNTLLEKIESLENKFDQYFSIKVETPKKKEVNTNAY